MNLVPFERRFVVALYFLRLFLCGFELFLDLGLALRLVLGGLLEFVLQSELFSFCFFTKSLKSVF